MTTQTTLLPWQLGQWQQLQKRHASGALPHALLLAGPPGTGKRQFTQHFINWLLCSGEKSDSGMCGECKHCRLIASETHPNIKFFEPEEKGKQIKIEQIRLLNEFMTQSGSIGGMKVAVIAPAEAMNVSASNAVLKTLEEPSGSALIVLLSHSPGMVLPTIRSRCQRLDFPLPARGASLDWLQGAGDYSAAEAESLLDLAAGAPFLALELAQEDALLEQDKMLCELAGLMKRELSPAAISERWADDVSVLRMEWLTRWLSLIIKSQQLGTSVVNFPAAGAKLMGFLAERKSTDRLFSVYDACIQQKSLLQGTSNPNKNLCFEYVLNRWLGLMQK